jgi:hypothetical protein
MTELRTTSRRRRARAHPVVSRDQEESTFGAILARLVAAVAGAHAAALVDAEGETVDYAGSLDPFELKVAAAHWQIALAEIATQAELPRTRQLTIRARRRSYVVRCLEEGYTIVLVLHPRAGFAASERALQEAHARLCSEAGFSEPPRAGRWFGVEVEPEPNDRARPARLHLANGWAPVEVMGSLVGLRPRERGFRVRLPNGAEMMLVRERLGRWFADEPIGA